MRNIFVCMCACVFKQHAAQCGLSLPDAGADGPSVLWEERAGSQTVSRVQRVLCSWVSTKISGAFPRFVPMHIHTHYSRKHNVACQTVTVSCSVALAELQNTLLQRIMMMFSTYSTCVSSE